MAKKIERVDLYDNEELFIPSDEEVSILKDHGDFDILEKIKIIINNKVLFKQISEKEVLPSRDTLEYLNLAKLTLDHINTNAHDIVKKTGLNNFIEELETEEDYESLGIMKFYEDKGFLTNGMIDYIKKLEKIDIDKFDKISENIPSFIRNKKFSLDDLPSA